jgi:hypothetical protein
MANRGSSLSDVGRALVRAALVLVLGALVGALAVLGDRVDNNRDR